MINFATFLVLVPTLQGVYLQAPLLPPQDARLVTVTAYSSEVRQTDSTPYLTASNKRVAEGIVAANFLRFGTKVTFPELYPNKVFTVQDRMARRHKSRVDIWMPSRHKAKNFGIKRKTKMIIL